ncbi:MAG: serine hydroxymethyltransferase [Patescibacteria group bacterium]|nr:serine hydroxymethyltransferase [Patescibacteria group bacterium]MDE1966398.1 serine hydroxymethyltransferase [Patescibacteria group bacterium]
MYEHIKKEDRKLFDLIGEERARQHEGLELIPSENYTSSAVMEAMGSILTNKYSEGYAGKRYYNGNEFIDEIETLAMERAKKLFKVPHANVQPYSGSPANLAVYLATCSPGDTIMGLALPEGGHLTHGWKVSATGLFFKSVPYHVLADGRIDMDEVRELAKKHRPKLIWAGATAYSFKYDYPAFAEIADSVGAYLAVDIAHIAGLILAGAHPSPVPHAHIVTTTTHKTLRGPRGGMIMVTPKGIAKDAELPQKIDKGVFPGLQGGPHDHQTAAIAVALKEAGTPAFRAYGKQIVKNAKALAKALRGNGLTLVAGGTENHLILLDLVPVFGPSGGVFASDALEAAGMTANKNTIPKDPGSPFYPSGVRLGTPALTSRGMKEKEMEKIGAWISRAVTAVKDFRLPEGKEERVAYLASFKKSLAKNKELAKIRAEIKAFAKKYPLPSDR